MALKEKDTRKQGGHWRIVAVLDLANCAHSVTPVWMNICQHRGSRIVPVGLAKIRPSNF